MRKLIVSMWITLDGFVAGTDDSMDWLQVNDQMMEYEKSFVDNADTLLLGRNTFNNFAGYWPTVAREDNGEPRQRAYAKRLDELEKIVISETEEVAEWANTERLSSIDKQVIINIKQRPGKDIITYGSLSVVNTLAELNLIDEYHLLVHPLYLREGKSLFKKGGATIALELISSKAFRSGVVLMKYSRAH
jgi:dihydrofolate reductase